MYAMEGGLTVRRKEQSSWARQSYMGYSYEAFSTIPASGVQRRDDDPEGWSGDVNTNVQVSLLSRGPTPLSALTAQWCKYVC